MQEVIRADAKVYAFDAMLKALQEVRNDPKQKQLSAKTREVVDEALCAAE